VSQAIASVSLYYAAYSAFLSGRLGGELNKKTLMTKLGGAVAAEINPAVPFMQMLDEAALITTGPSKVYK